MTELTSEGFSRTRLADRLVELQTSIQAIFGPDLNLDPDTMDGQTLGLFAEFISNLDQLAEDVYQSFNPQSATGAALARLVQLNGIRKREGTYSTVTVTCTGTAGTVIPAGSLVKSTSTNAQFETLAEATIGGGGTVNVNCQAVELGAVSGPQDTITKIDTPIYGWQSVNNAAAAVLGRDEETDEALRTRRRLSTSTPAQAIIDGVRGALLNIPEVLQVKVYENYEDTTDANGLPPHSMNVVVVGGDDDEIAETIFLRRSAGVTMVGAEEVVVNDSMDNPHTIKFDRPTDKDIYVIINMTTKTGWPTDGADRIKEAIIDWALENQEIGEELVWSNLYIPINTVPGVSVTSLFVDDAPAPATLSNISVAFNELASFTEANITVNVS